MEDVKGNSSNCNEDVKFKSTINKLNEDYTNFLYTLMSPAGFNEEERNIDGKIFRNYMHLSLIVMATKLKNLKETRSCTLKEEEIQLIAKLKPKKSRLKGRPEMITAINLFEINIFQAMKNVMIQAQLGDSELLETSDDFILFFSKAFLFLANKFFTKYARGSPEKSRENYSTKQYTEESQDLDTVKGIKLVTITSKFYIYKVTTRSRKMALKVINSDQHEHKNDDTLKNELRVSQILKHHSIRSAIQKTTYRDRESLLLDWATGKPLSQINRKFKIPDFLVLAREIVSAIVKLHENDLMHLNLSCEHIILDEKQNSLKVIGVGHAQSFKEKANVLSLFELLEKDIRCVSPEQTGRSNREIDYRSDFYSLGIIFYKLLTGRYPLEADNAFDLICMHVMQEPPKLCNEDEDIPMVVSEMISKLLEKNAENRYQSIVGIIYDLDMMITEISSDKSLSSITLGEHDLSKTLRIPQTLYGRCLDLEALDHSFQRACCNSFEFVLIAGKAGTGKSVLTKELNFPVARARGLLASGKFDKSKSPFSALREAVFYLCNSLLLKDKPSLYAYKSKILEAVGEEGKVLTNLISNLHKLIGHQPPIVETFGKEAKNRLNYVLVKFFRAICSFGTPVVLVLDDLQWVDLASLNFLVDLVSEKSIKNFMIVATYRQDEVTDEHPLAKIVDAATKNQLKLTKLVLGNLDQDTVNSIVCDSLQRSPIESYALSSFLYSKTNGDPLFVNQMLQSIYDQGVIYIGESMKWEWDLSKLGVKSASNVVELLREKISGFESSMKQVFLTASCIGSPFLLSNLRIITNNEKAIRKVLSTGLVVRNNRSNHYRFVHDEVEKACSSLLPKDPRKIFLYIAHKLLLNYSEKELEENVFVVGNLLLEAVDEEKDVDKRQKAAEILSKAGSKAMSITAFQLSANYFQKALVLLNIDCWSKHYSFSRTLFGEASKAAYCIGNYELMKKCIDAIFMNATSTQHLIHPYWLKVRHNNDCRSFEEAIKSGEEILRKMNTVLRSSDYNEAQATEEIQNTKKLLSNLPPTDIFKWKNMEDESSLSVMRIYTELLYSSFFFNPLLFKLITARMLRLTYERGISKFASYAFCCFGTFFCTNGDKAGLKFGKIALQLLKQTNAKELIPKVYTSYYTRVSPFYEPIYKVFDPLLKSYRVGYEVGLSDDGAPCVHVYCVFSFLCGRELSRLVNEMRDLKEKLRHQAQHAGFLSIYQACLNLLGEATNPNPALLQGKMFDFSVLYNDETKKHDAARASLYCSIVAYLFYDFRSAFKFLQCYRPLMNLLKNSSLHPYFLFYEGLISLALDQSCNNKEEMINHVKENVSQLRKFAENAPENNLNKVYILETDLAMYFLDDEKVHEYFNRAASLSEAHCFINEKAIVCERMGKYYINSEKKKASFYLNMSYKCYTEWQAIEKARHLIETYPFYFSDCMVKNLDFSWNHPTEVDSDNQTFVSKITTDLLSISSSSQIKSKRVRFEEECSCKKRMIDLARERSPAKF